MTKKMKVEDLYVEDIIRGVAKKMNALYVEEHNTTKLTIPETVGEGYLNATQFASGLGIIEACYCVKEDTIIEMEKNKVNPLKFVFNLGDTFYHRFEKDDDFEEVNTYKGAIIGSSIDCTHSFKIPEGKEIKFFSLELNRNLFEHKINSFRFDLDEELRTLLQDVKAVNPFFFSYAFGAEVNEMIKKILNNTKHGFIGSLHKEGLTYSILSRALERYLGDTEASQEENLNDGEIDIIVKVSDFIESNLSELPTIDIIANDNLLSEVKLQRLFNSYYNCTVHDFIRNKRLTQARELLENTNQTIAEIADNVGIRSNSYLSKIFKERYGVTPSNYRGSRLSKIRFY